MKAFQTIALSKVIKDKEQKSARNELQPGDYEVDFLARITGSFKVGQDFEKTPTVKIPWTLVCAVALSHLNETTQNAVLRDVAKFVKEETGDTLEKETKEKVTKKLSKMLGEAPKIMSKGMVSTRLSVTVEEKAKA